MNDRAYRWLVVLLLAAIVALLGVIAMRLIEISACVLQDGVPTYPFREH